jgi:hypothetical protein
MSEDNWWDSAPQVSASPDGENWWEAAPLVRKPDATVAGAARTAAQGLTFGGSDELEAAIRAAYTSATSDKSLSDAYNEHLGNIRQSVKDFGEAHPYLSTGLEVAGSLPTMFIPGVGEANAARAATLAGRLYSGAKTGAKVGALYGYGSGEGGVQNRLANAGEGALKGAGVGSAAEAVAPVVGAAINGVKASGNMLGNAFDANAALRASADEKLSRAIGRNTLPEGGTMTPQDAAKWLEDMQSSTALGPKSAPKPDMLPLNLADTGTGTQRLARAVAGVPGAGSDLAKKALFERHEGQFGRMYDQFKQSLGVKSADYFKTESRILEEQRNASRPAYQRAFLGQQKFDLSNALGKWRLQASIEGGDLQNALNKAIGIVQKQLRTDPYSIGALRGVEPVPRPTVQTDPMSPLTGAVNIVPGKPPAWMPLRSFDGAKRAIDSMIEKFQARGANSEVRLLTLFKNDLLKDVDAANPLYKTARDEFSSRAELLDAMKLGRKAFTGDVEVTGAAFKDMSNAEQKMFKIGMAQEAKKSMGNKRFGEDLALMYDRPNSQELFESVMSKGKFERHQVMSEGESRMAQTKNMVTGNSQTAEKLADQNDLNMVQTMGKAIADKGLAGAAMSGLGDFIQRMFRMREAEAHLLAKDLFETDPAKLKVTLDRVQSRYGVNARQRLQQQMSSYVAKPLRLVGAEQAGLSAPQPQKKKRQGAFDDIIGSPLEQRADGGEVSSGGAFDDILSGAKKHLGESVDAIARAPGDVKQYWNSLPESDNSYATLPTRAVEGANYVIDAGLRGVSGGKWGLSDVVGATGLPTSALSQGIEDFGKRNAAGLQVLRDAGDVAAGVAPTIHSPYSAEGKASPANGPLASRVVPGYNPIPKPLRPFEADYPNGAKTDGLGKPAGDTGGRLVADIEGRPLTADVVVGRRVVGGQDEAIPQAAEPYDALAKALIGSESERVAPREIGGDAGRMRKLVDEKTWKPYSRIYLSRDLTPSQSVRTLAHENGHAIDEMAGQIPTKGLSKELEFLYNALAAGQERSKNLMRPKDLKYTPDEAPREMMAEAIRAYLADPNYIKTVAPKTAAAIRAAVNGNPRLNRTIQFNAAAPLAAGLGGLAAGASGYRDNRRSGLSGLR